MTMAEKPVYEQVQDLLNKWNKPATDGGMALLLGEKPEPGDTRATVSAAGMPDHDRNPGSDKIDAQRMFADDGDDGLPEVPLDEDGNPDYDSMKNDDLKAHLAARDLPVSGKHAALVERLESDDESDEDEEDDDDE